MVQSSQLNAYKKTQETTLSGRELEASVLTKAAKALKECQENWEDSSREEMLDEAIRFNQTIWSILQTELAREDNPLPRDIRLNLLRLSAFVDKRCFDVMAYPAMEKLSAIININLNIAAGLKGSPSDT